MKAQIRQAVKDLRSDRERGARQLALAALEALASVTDDDRAEFRESARALAFARPMMAAVQNAVALAWSNCLAGSEPAAAVQDAIDSIEIAPEGMTLAARSIAPRDTIMTYSYSSTVVELLSRLKTRRAIISEARPLGEGLAQARELRSAGIAVTFITEAQIALFVQEADAVIVGADTILPEGDLINKIGTRLLALAANDAGIPFYSVTETLKVAAPSEPMPFAPEEGRRREITSARWLEVRNVYFEATPGRLLTGYITEDGIIKPGKIAPYAKRADERWRALML
jgi:translation initiation factor eIF-2B subunit delta